MTFLCGSLQSRIGLCFPPNHNNHPHPNLAASHTDAGPSCHYHYLSKVQFPVIIILILLAGLPKAVNAHKAMRIKQCAESNAHKAMRIKHSRESIADKETLL